MRYNQVEATIGQKPMNYKDVFAIYGVDLLAYGVDGIAKMYLDPARPEGWMGQPLSFWVELLGSVGGVAGAFLLPPPFNLGAALFGGYLTTQLIDHAARIASPTIVAVVTPTVYTPPMTYAPPGVRAPVVTQRGTYIVT